MPVVEPLTASDLPAVLENPNPLDSEESTHSLEALHSDLMEIITKL